MEGRWTGYIKQPFSGTTLKAELVFDDSDIVQFWIEGQKVELKDPTYNLFKELEGSFRTKLDGIYSEETRCGFKLKLD